MPFYRNGYQTGKSNIRRGGSWDDVSCPRCVKEHLFTSSLAVSWSSSRSAGLLVLDSAVHSQPEADEVLGFPLLAPSSASDTPVIHSGRPVCRAKRTLLITISAALNAVNGPSGRHTKFIIKYFPLTLLLENLGGAIYKTRITYSIPGWRLMNH